MKTKLLLTILIIITLWSCQNKTTSTHNPTNDSIQKYLTLAEIDTLPNAQRYQYNKKAYSFIDLTKNDTATRWYLYKTSMNLLKLKKYKNYRKISGVNFIKSSKINDTLNLARYYLLEGDYFRVKNIFDSSFYFYNKSENLLEYTKDRYPLGIVLKKKAYLQYLINDYTQSQLTILKAIKIFKEIKNDKEIFESELIEVTDLLELGEHLEAKRKYKLLLKKTSLQPNLERDINRAYVLNNLSTAHSYLNEIDSSYNCVKSTK